MISKLESLGSRKKSTHRPQASTIRRPRSRRWARSWK